MAQRRLKIGWMSFANDGFATSTSGRPPLGSTVDSKSAHPHASVIAVRSEATTTRITMGARIVRPGSARIGRLLVQMNSREHACGKEAARRVEELTGEACRPPGVHGAAEKSVRASRAQLEDGMIGIAGAIGTLDSDVEDRLLAQHADTSVGDERKARHRARREHFQREVLRFEMVIALAAVADLRVVHRFAFGPPDQVLEARDRAAHLP